MPAKPVLIAALFACLLLPACETVRTVYDEGGNVVKPDEGEGAKESDLFSAYEKRFDAAFSEKRNAQGVPEARSGRVSAFQKELDSARSTKNSYATKAFGGLREDDSRSRSFNGSKVYAGGKVYEGGSTRSMFSRDTRPDFMNESHGIAHTDYQGGERSRSEAEGVASDDSGRIYSTHASNYRREQESGYFEERRDATPAPPIYDHKDTQTREIMNIRNILGRDKTDAQE